MSGKGITINVSGGTMQAGAVSQGDANRIKTTIGGEPGVSVEDVKALRSSIEEEAAAQEVSFAQVRELQAKLEEMEAMAAKGGSMKAIGSFAKSLHDNFGWAAKPLGVFLAGVVAGI